MDTFAVKIEYQGKPAVQAIFKDITEKKRAEASLRSLLEQYKSLQNNIPIGVFRTSAGADGLIISANPALARMHGFKNPEEMCKMRAKDLYMDDNDRKRFIEQISREGKISNYVVKLKKKDGSSFIASLSASAITNSEGKILYFDGIVEDITEKIKMDKLHSSIYKISEAVHKTKDLDELYSYIHSIINELMNAKNFFIALYDPSTNMITFDYYVDEIDKTTWAKKSRKFSDGLTEYVLKTGKPLLATQKAVNQLIKKGKINPYGPLPVDWLGVPLKANGKIIGMLAVQNYTKGIRLTEKDMDILKFVSTQIAMAIERKSEEEALRNSEEKYRGVVDNFLLGLYITQSHILKFCNKRFAEMFGYDTAEELIGKHIREFVAEESWRIVDKQMKLREYGKKKSAQYEFKGIKKDGTIFDIETAGTRIIFEGKPAIQGSMVDITERKKAEEELRKMATMDVLTQTYNRGYGLLFFGKELKTAKRDKKKLSICYIDVDGLKDINDTYGHLEGDEALKLVTNFFQESSRETDIICRIGGDEFLIIFPNCSLKKARTVWERIAQRVSSFNRMKYKPYSISLSRGFAEFDPENPKSVDQLIAQADYAMYKDKQSKLKKIKPS